MNLVVLMLACNCFACFAGKCLHSHQSAMSAEYGNVTVINPTVITHDHMVFCDWSSHFAVVERENNQVVVATTDISAMCMVMIIGLPYRELLTYSQDTNVGTEVIGDSMFIFHADLECKTCIVLDTRRQPQLHHHIPYNGFGLASKFSRSESTGNCIAVDGRDISKCFEGSQYVLFPTGVKKGEVITIRSEGENYFIVDAYACK